MSILRFRKDSQKKFHDEKATQLDFESIHEDGGKRNKSNIKRLTLVLALVLFSMWTLIALVAYIRHSIQFQTSSTETKDDIIYLNETTSLFPFYYGNLKNHPSTGPKIDILVIGTRNNPTKPQTQKETWASHPSRRHFFLATEYDDHDPMCDQHRTLEDIKKDLMTCKWRGLEISSDAPQAIQKKFKTYYSREEWLLKRKNPAGWYCAQKRHSVGLAKVIALYQGLNQPNQLPDYLFVGDDDSYVNLDHISEMLLLQPQRLEASTGISQEHSPVPTHDTPVVWTGCRVRWPVHEVNFTFGYGGFGHFFSRASLLRMLQPLYCNSTSTAPHPPDSAIPMEMASYEKHACERLKSENALIGEDKHFVPGMNLMDVWFNMTKLDPFCMHADWIYGYFVNYYR